MKNQSLFSGKPAARLWRCLGLGLILAAITAIAQAQTPANPYDYTRTSSFTYKPNGVLESETVEPDTPASCVVTTYSYDDAYGNKTGATTSNCAGTVPALAQFDSRSNRTAYAPATPPVVSVAGVNVTLPPGAFPITRTNALSQSESREFDPRFGAVTKLTGPNQLSTTWTLDAFGRTLRETRADGTYTETFYCHLPDRTPGNDLSSNTPNCPVAAAAQVPADAVMFVHSQARDSTGATVGPYTRVFTDRLGREVRTVTQGFDGASQPTALYAASVVVDTLYNAFGVKTVQTQPYFLRTGASTTSDSNNVGATHTEVDLLGRPTTIDVTDADGSVPEVDFGGVTGKRRAARTRIQYDGLSTLSFNDKGQSRKEEKNPEGQLVRITDNNGARLVHQYDAFGNLIATVDALGNTISLSVDVRGRKTALVDPDAGRSEYDYDALGQLVAQRNANQLTQGTQTTLRYDRLGRLIQRSEPEYTSSWSYDNYADGSPCNKGIGKLCESNTSHGIHRKTRYDDLGRPLSTRTTLSNGPSFATALSYDSASRVSSQTYPTGLNVSYGYTGLGFLEKVVLGTSLGLSALPAIPGGPPGATGALSAGKVLWLQEKVNAWGFSEQQTDGSGVNSRSVYDPLTGRITARSDGLSTATNVLNHAYVWDSLGNLSQRTDGNGDAQSGAVSEVFHYEDSLNRLTSYTVAAPAISGLSRNVTLQYNVLGQLTSKSDVGSYAYNAASHPHALKSLTWSSNGGGTTTYGYDAAGNLTSASGGAYRSIAYTSFNLPDSSSGIAGPNNSPRYTWKYDENHQRIQETRSIAGGAQAGTRTTWMLHPDAANGLSFESETNSPTSPSAANPAVTSNRHYISAGGKTVVVLVSTGALPTLQPEQTAPTVLASMDIVKVEYWHTDHLGSLAATTDHTGAVTARYAYDPFGKRRFPNGNYDGQATITADWSPAVNSGTDRGFTGHEQLDDIGLVHMNGRLFDATLGVFLQPDPLIAQPDDLQSYHRYGYCFNNPLTCTDPTGFRFLPGLNSTINHVVRIGYELTGLHMIGVSFEDYRIAAAIAVAVVLGPEAGAAAGWGTFGQAAVAGFASGAIASGTVEGGLQGAFSAGMFYGAGNLMQGGNFFTGGMDRASAITDPMAQIALHGTVGCVTSMVGGSKCGPGALSAAFSKAAVVNGLTSPSNPVEGVIVSATIGGTASVLGGGKFANGAQTAAFSYIFNCLGHPNGPCSKLWGQQGATAGLMLGTGAAVACDASTLGGCLIVNAPLVVAGTVGLGALGYGAGGLADWLYDNLTYNAGTQHTPDQQALGELISDQTLGGRRPLTNGQADQVLDWADEVGLPARDDRQTTHWVGGPHIHVEGSRVKHIPVDVSKP